MKSSQISSGKSDLEKLKSKLKVTNRCENNGGIVRNHAFKLIKEHLASRHFELSSKPNFNVAIIAPITSSNEEDNKKNSINSTANNSQLANLSPKSLLNARKSQNDSTPSSITTPTTAAYVEYSKSRSNANNAVNEENKHRSKLRMASLTTMSNYKTIGGGKILNQRDTISSLSLFNNNNTEHRVGYFSSVMNKNSHGKISEGDLVGKKSEKKSNDLILPPLINKNSNVPLFKPSYVLNYKQSGSNINVKIKIKKKDFKL